MEVAAMDAAISVFAQPSTFHFQLPLFRRGETARVERWMQRLELFDPTQAANAKQRIADERK